VTPGQAKPCLSDHLHARGGCNWTRVRQRHSSVSARSGWTPGVAGLAREPDRAVFIVIGQNWYSLAVVSSTLGEIVWAACFTSTSARRPDTRDATS